MINPATRAKLQIALLAGVLLCAIGIPALEIAEHVGEAPAFSSRWFREAGAPLGLAAVILLTMQFVIAARLKWLDRIVPLNRQFYAHRFFGGAALACALAHPLLMFYPVLFEKWRLSLSHWPEFVGALALISLAGASLGALLRDRLRLPFHLWLPMHRAGTISIAAAAGVHTAFVEGHFEAGASHVLLGAGLAIYLVSFFRKGLPCTVTAVRSVGGGTVAVDLKPASGGTFSYAPGQFAFVTFCSSSLPREEHPWTISSSPAEPDTLQFTIKKCGDFTDRIGSVRQGDRALIKGPYGRFSYSAFSESDRAIVMIAGGIGITPFLSMLRHMAGASGTRRVVLLWSLKTRQDLVWQEELERLAAEKEWFTLHCIFTREPQSTGPAGRLNAQRLAPLLAGIGPSPYVFICGPAGMKKALLPELGAIGLDRRNIISEEFRL